MIKFNKQLGYIFLFFLILGCANKNTVDTIDEIHVNLEKKPNTFPYKQCFEQPNYIPLETNANSLIASIDKVIFYESKFYILDRTQKQILIFDSQGNYISKISSIGKGSGEYLSINDIDICMTKLYVLCRDSKKIQTYDLNDKFVKEIKLKYYYSRFNLEGEKSAILYSNFSNNGKNKNLTRISLLNGKILNTFHKYFPFFAGTGYGTSVFSEDNGVIYYTIPYDYGIYKITNKNPELTFNISFKHEQMLSQNCKEIILDSDNIKDKIIKINPLIIIDDKVIFNVVYSGYNRTVLYKNKKVYHGILSGEDTPLTSNSLVGKYNNNIISFIETNSIIAGLKYGSEDYKIRLKQLPFVQNIKRSDNSILILTKIKDE